MERRNDNLKRRKAPRNKADLDPRLVEMVKFLARAAAERDYERLHEDGKASPHQRARDLQADGETEGDQS